MYFWELGIDMLENSTGLDGSLGSFQREGIKQINMRTVDFDINSNVLWFMAHVNIYKFQEILYA